MSAAACKVILDQGSGLIAAINCAASGIGLAETTAIRATLADSDPDLWVDPEVAVQIGRLLTETREQLDPLVAQLIRTASSQVRPSPDEPPPPPPTPPAGSPTEVA